MKQSIFPYDFAPFYPMGIQPCPMYVDVANRVYKRIKEVELGLPDADNLKKKVAINIAMYFEDKMSRIGLWNAFVSKHLQMYSRPLPFFENIEELDEDDINAQEIPLLIWLVVSRDFDDRFLNPIVMIESISDDIYGILAAYEDVDVNDDLYDFIYDKAKADDYFKINQTLMWLRRSYLMSSPISDERFNGLMHSYTRLFNKSKAAYYAETTFCMTTEIGPLALEPHIWLAEMYHNDGLLAEAEWLSNLEYRQQDIFIVTEADAEYAVLKGSDGEEYKIKNLFRDIFYKGAYVGASLVKYGNNDWEADSVIFESQEEVYNKVCEREQQLKILYEQTYPTFLECTGGKRLAFFSESGQVKEWLDKTFGELNMNGFNLPGGEQVAFISKKGVIVYVPDIVHAIKSDDNPYYGKCDARILQSETMNAVLNTEAMHPEMLKYLLENDLLQDGDISASVQSKLGNKIFTQNIDFIARNHRRHHYHDHDF